MARSPSGRCLFGTVCLVAGLTLSLGKTDSVSFEGLIAFHLALAAMLAIGALFDDLLAGTLRRAGARAAHPGLHAHRPPRRLPWLCQLTFVSPEMVRIYPMILVVIATSYGFLFGSRAHLFAATLVSGGWLGT